MSITKKYSIFNIKYYLNNELQDEQFHYPSQMTGKLTAKNGEQLNIKTNISDLPP
jgi:hypothetical protein